MGSIIRAPRAADAGNKLSKGRQFTPRCGMSQGYDGATLKFATRVRNGGVGDTASKTEMHR